MLNALSWFLRLISRFVHRTFDQGDEVPGVGGLHRLSAVDWLTATSKEPHHQSYPGKEVQRWTVHHTKLN